MITVENIIEWSKPHLSGIEGAKRTRIYDENIEVSIVGGGRGLYGDFNETFEIALFDRDTNEFITKIYSPETNDDVIPYMKAEEMITFLNKIFYKGFQVR